MENSRNIPDSSMFFRLINVFSLGSYCIKVVSLTYAESFVLQLTILIRLNVPYSSRYIKSEYKVISGIGYV